LASIDSVDGAEITARDGNRITLSTTVDALSPRLVGININLP
jgi:hypothetical protein